MIEIIPTPEVTTLDEYASHSRLAAPVAALRRLGRSNDSLRGRKVWMVNSTETGGGVAEMLPKLVPLIREAGVEIDWVVVGTRDDRFFALTKRIHNLLHGVGSPVLTHEERVLYEEISEGFADELQEIVKPNDVLVIHDPQPLAAGAILHDRIGVPAVWRCHIGLDQRLPATDAAWAFLEQWVRPYGRVVFTLDAYVPDFLKDRAALIPPAIDPVNEKNRDLDTHALTGILAAAKLVDTPHPTGHAAFDEPAMRLQPDGSFGVATEPEDIGLLFRPIISQVSRWDKLKGFGPLLEGFVRMKQGRIAGLTVESATHARMIDSVRLVLIGPDPASVQDDPEGKATFDALSRVWLDLPPELQRDVAVLVLPMSSRERNADMVNALQRCSTIVVQNSLREGFGLTVTEAMWKRRPILGSQAAGIRSQVTDGVEGRLVTDSEDPEEIGRVLHEMLARPERLEEWGRHGEHKAAAEYLVFTQVARWLNVLTACC